MIKSKLYRIFTAAVVILTTYETGYAQPDSCYQATNLSLCSPVAVSNAGATSSGDDAYAPVDICATTLDRTLWFTFTAPTAGMYEVLINTTSCTAAGTIEAGVLTGNCGGPFISVGCQTGAPVAPVVFTATTMQQFFIVVDGTATDSCSFTIEVCQHCNAGFTSSINSGVWPLPVTFTNTSVGTVTYSWDFGFTGGSTTDTDPVMNFDNPGTYNVILTASNTYCSDTASATIIVTGPSALTVPNVFSPNDDGINDFWKPDAHGVLSISCWVFNRWGEIVHYWEGVNGGWDGHTTPAGVSVPEGVYFYKILAEGYDGQVFEENGNVSIFR